MDETEKQQVLTQLEDIRGDVRAVEKKLRTLPLPLEIRQNLVACSAKLDAVDAMVSMEIDALKEQDV